MASQTNPVLAPDSRTAHVLFKTIVASIVVMATNTAGNLFLKVGLDRARLDVGWAPGPYIAAFSHLWIDVGVICLIAWMFSRLALLSWADLSYVMPVTAFSYVLTPIVGALFLHEHVTVLEWLGSASIALGVAVTMFTFPETAPETRPK
jgi:drug/metabolite transporter (DMT)-like permease